MTDDPVSIVVSQLGILFGNDAARIIGAAMVLVIVTAHGIMPWIPVATTANPKWYVHLYAVLKFISGNYRNASPAGKAP